MIKPEVIKRFCALASLVTEQVFGYQRESSDCFCEESEHEGNFQFSSRVMTFIELAVKKEVHRRRICNETSQVTK